MYAVAVYTQIDMTHWEEARDGIQVVKTRLTNSEGFESAIWMMPIDGRGLMISRWRDEPSAAAAAPPVGFSPAPGVTVTSVETREVIDQA
jgi:hypothetical protein